MKIENERNESTVASGVDSSDLLAALRESDRMLARLNGAFRPQLLQKDKERLSAIHCQNRELLSQNSEVCNEGKAANNEK